MKINIKTNLIRKVKTILKKEDRKTTYEAIKDIVNLILEVGLVDHEIGSEVNLLRQRD